MFEEGNILYFNPFYFENGNPPKPKYFLVLARLDNQLVLASLPTSHDHIPCSLPKVHGCIDDYTINFNCYYFQAGKVVAYDSGNGTFFSFPRDTYVYGYRIALFDIGLFSRQIANHSTVVSVKGKLLDEEYRKVVYCLKRSASVKRKLRKLL